MPNTINDWQTVARVHDPERIKWWQEVFDGDTCPVTSIVPRWGDFPGIGTAQFYNLDMKAITAEQKQKLILSIADKFKLTVKEVATDIDMVGVPILASDVVVSSSDFGHIASIVM